MFHVGIHLKESIIALEGAFQSKTQTDISKCNWKMSFQRYNYGATPMQRVYLQIMPFKGLQRYVL